MKAPNPTPIRQSLGFLSIRPGFAFGLLLTLFLWGALRGENPLEAAQWVDPEDWAVISSRDEQMKRDEKFLYATLFPDPDRALLFERQFANALSEDQKRAKPLLPRPDDDMTAAETRHRSQILGRLILALALGGGKYTINQNDKAHLMDWRWPLAVSLCHGQRVVLECHGSFTDAALYALMISGPPVTKDLKAFKDAYGRLLASHGLGFGQDRKTLFEEKLGKKDFKKNLHYGLIGFNGFAVDPGTCHTRAPGEGAPPGGSCRPWKFRVNLE
jgi:hypothetical protein